MTQDEIIRMAREVFVDADIEGLTEPQALERFAALVAAHVKSDQINTAYQQGCEDMKHRMEKRMQQLESQLQLCQTAVADERDACAKVCEQLDKESCDWVDTMAIHCAKAIRARGEK